MVYKGYELVLFSKIALYVTDSQSDVTRMQKEGW